MRADPEADRIAIHCASIIVAAHGMARDVPAQAPAARRIVELTRALYAIMPSEETIGRMVEGFVAEMGADVAGRRTAREGSRALVQRLWHHFRHGTSGYPA